MSDTVLVSILGLIGTLGGALISQYISARTAVKMKKIELVYARKVDAYKLLLKKAGEFAADPKVHPKYLVFQSALHAALIVASEEVSEALDDPRKNSLHLLLNAFAYPIPKTRCCASKCENRYSSMEAVKNTMRADVGELFSN